MTTETKTFLSRPLAVALDLDWEKLAWLILLALTLASRFYDLQFGALHHDEVIHASWSWELYRGIGYQHNPIFHGPFLYHFQALVYLLFGATDATARVGPAIFGTVLVMLPWFLRKELGRAGAWLVGALIFISPSILYYSRHLRHDIFSATCTLLMVIAVIRYLDGQRERWLYVLTGALVISFMNHELTFITVFILGTFLFLMGLSNGFGIDWSRLRRWEERLQQSGVGQVPLFGFIAVFIVLFVAFIALLIAALVRALLALLGKVFNQRDPSPRWAMTDLIVLLGTLTAPFFSPFLVNILGKALEALNVTLPTINTPQGPIQLVVNPIDYTTGGIVVTAIIYVLVLIASVLVGLRWDVRRWLISAAVFYVPFVVLYTTLFTNPQGLATGAVGSLGYWLTQQDYKRGDQPGYYYLIIVPLYEFLALGLSLLGAVWIALGRGRPSDEAVGATHASPPDGSVHGAVEVSAEASSAEEEPSDSSGDRAGWDVLQAPGLFPVLLVYWTVLSFIIYSYAGEKMPWLTIHVALPLAVLGGWTLAHVVTGADWRGIWQRGGALLALLVPLILVVAAALLGRRPFAGDTAADLSQTMQWLSFVLILAVLGGTWVWLAGWRVGVLASLRVLAVTLVLFLAAFTVRAAVMASFIHGDVAKDMLIYTQTTPDVPRMNDRVTEISQRLGTDYRTKLIHDEEMRTVLWWYWRDYDSVIHQDLNTSNFAPDNEAPVVWIGANHDDKVRPLMGQYNRYTGRMRWWFPEDYRGLDLIVGQEDGGLQFNQGAWDRMTSTFTDPDNRETMIQFLLYRELPNPLGSWDFVCYVRKDVDAGGGTSAEPGTVSPFGDLEEQYKARATTWSSIRTWGSLGAEEGQLNAPKGLAVGPDGNIYVADSGNHRIQVFDPMGQFVRGWGQPGSGPGEFQEPWGIAVAPDGTVYVADTWNHRVQVFDTLGTFQAEYTRTLSLGFYGPRDIALDAAGNVFFTDTGNKRILEFAPDGEVLGDWGTPGAWEAQFNEPVGIAIGPEGDIYVADTWNLRVQRFDGQMNYESQWPVAGWYGQSVLNKPFLAVDKHGGYLYAADPEGARIIRWTGNGILLNVWGTPGTGPDEFNSPTGVVIDEQGYIYVSDSGNHRIVVFPPLP